MAKINDDIVMIDRENETNKESKIPKKVFEGGQIGIKNLGNTCYMSSALQCLFHTEELVDYFFSKDYKNDLFNYSKTNSRDNNAIISESNNVNSNSGVDYNFKSNNNQENNNNIDKGNNNIIVSNFNNAKNNYNNNLNHGKNENNGNQINIELGVNSSSKSKNNIEPKHNNANSNGNCKNNETLFGNGIVIESYEKKVEGFDAKLRELIFDVEKMNRNENTNCREKNENKYLIFSDINSKNKNERELNKTNDKYNNKNYEYNSNNRINKSLLQFDDEDVIVLDSSDSKEEIGESCENKGSEENKDINGQDLKMIIDDKNETFNDNRQSQDFIDKTPNYIFDENINEINSIQDAKKNLEQTNKELNKIYDINNFDGNNIKQNTALTNNFSYNNNSNNETSSPSSNKNKNNNSEEYCSANAKQIQDSSELNQKGGASQESFKTLPSIPIPFKHDDEKEKQLILFTQNFKDLIQKMWSKSAELINPKEFRESLICLNSQFNNYSQQDAHELLTFILESLHVKLNRGAINLQSELNANNYFDKLSFNEEQQQNFNLSLNKTQSIINWENHVYFNDSVINDYFYGLLLSSLTCKKCGSTNVTYEPFNHLGLSIPNEFHLFIYFVPDFNKGFFDGKHQVINNGINNNTINIPSNSDKSKSFSDEMKNEEGKNSHKNNQKSNFNSKEFSNCFSSTNNKNRNKSFPKAIKMYIKINDNMQFKNIIDTVSERLNYPIENGVFYAVMDNQLVKVIENDERCGELIQRNFFLFLAETRKDETFQLKDDLKINANYNNFNKSNYGDIDINQTNNSNGIRDVNCANDNGESRLNAIKNYGAEEAFKTENTKLNYSNENMESFDKNSLLLVNFNFFPFPKGKFNPKQKTNPISYPRILNYLTRNNPLFIFSILHDLLKYAELIFQKKSEKENIKDLENTGSNRHSSRYSNDSSSENVKGNNRKTKGQSINNNKAKNKKSNESNNKSNAKNCSDNASNKNEDSANLEEKSYSFLYEVCKTKNFIFCNKAVLLDDSNTFFSTENTQEKFQSNGNNNNNNNSNSKTYASEKTNARIRSSLLANSNSNEAQNNENSDPVLNQSSSNKFLKDKFICLFCLSVDSVFFYCDCLNEFIVKNQVFFETDTDKSLVYINSFANENMENPNNNENSNNPLNQISSQKTNQSNNNKIHNNLSLSSVDFCKIKKNFILNFLSYYKQSEASKNLSSDLLTEISLFAQEDLAKDSFRLLNACKDLTSLQQKETLITLYDLLDYFTAEEKLREEKFYCLNCNEWISRVKRLEINKFPNILIINFKRFRYDIIQPKGRSTRRALENSSNSFNIYGGVNNSNLSFGGEKNENKIDFPFDLDLTKFNRYGENTKYELYAVCNHEGKISGGHYKAVCKDFQSNKWFEFDDKIVKQINQNTIVSHKAYILFYRRKKE